MSASRAYLVEESPLVLSYHNGPLLSSSSALEVNLIWYGKFTPVQRSILADFVQSLGAPGNGGLRPSVSAWWKITQGYKDASNAAALTPRLGFQKLDEAYSKGKTLTRSDVAALAESVAQSGAPPENSSNAIYLVLTAADVSVERFCLSSCGFHGGLEYGKSFVPYAWVGNSETQCPGQCAWPFHQPLYGPQTPPLVSPNADVGIDGGRCCPAGGCVGLCWNLREGGLPRFPRSTADR
ncbi:hypothetical protein SUGI_1141760 [Cryptomeria japonica]|nr:hypothetical protein SUGI_1141760 [Cryptomeria japonica]